MSIKLMNDVWRQDLPPDEKLILLSIADLARNDGSGAYPTINYLSEKTGYSCGIIHKALKSLVEKRLLAFIPKDFQITIPN